MSHLLEADIAHEQAFFALDSGSHTVGDSDCRAESQLLLDEPMDRNERAGSLEVYLRINLVLL